MKVHRIDSRVVLPISVEKAWDFFSNPDNLEAITPKEMAMKNVYPLDESRIYPGMLIVHEVAPFPLVKMTWITEITHVDKHKRFVDEQRKGPFAMWHHIHEFAEHPEGAEVRDLLYYAMPFGLLGRLAGKIQVHRQVRSVFEFREAALRRMYPAAP